MANFHHVPSNSLLPKFRKARGQSRAEASPHQSDSRNFFLLTPFPSKVFWPCRETQDPIWTYFPQRNHLYNDSYASHEERRIKLALNFPQSLKANLCLHLLSTMYPVQGLFPSHCWQYTAPAPDNCRSHWATSLHLRSLQDTNGSKGDKNLSSTLGKLFSCG